MALIPAAIGFSALASIYSGNRQRKEAKRAEAESLRRERLNAAYSPWSGFRGSTQVAEKPDALNPLLQAIPAGLAQYQQGQEAEKRDAILANQEARQDRLMNLYENKYGRQVEGQQGGQQQMQPTMPQLRQPQMPAYLQQPQQLQMPETPWDRMRYGQNMRYN
jgi:hypothetical protein